MRKYKLDNDPKKSIPSEEMIAKHKSFNDLRVQYNEVTKRQHIPLYKNKRMFLLLILIAVTAYAIYVSNENEKQEDSKSTTIEKQIGE